MKKYRPAARLQLYLGSLGVLGIMLACSLIGVGTDPTTTSTPNSGKAQILIKDGIVKIQDENGDQTPVAGDSFFDVTAELESIDPWTVADINLETDDETQIEEGLQVGDLVRVQGIILEDGTWLANSIELAEEQIDPIIILIGKVDSVDPLVVNGIELNVTEDTDIQGTITPGMFVRVEILLLPDGTWEVLSIVPFGEPDEDAQCVTVVVTIVEIEGDEIQFSGWPVITLGEDVEIEGGLETMRAGQIVVAVVCPSKDGQIIIVQIIIQDNGDDEIPSEAGEKVLVCHKPDKKGGHTISIASPAVPAHLAHGDTLGACP
ncbi:MAG: DUF5666 domain-containing protein [Anaerolineales bacterium]|jgi:hypothetical protein